MAGGTRAQKVMTQPINVIFRLLQNRARVQIWLYGQDSMRIEAARIVGLDEYFNLVLDEAEEVNSKTKTRRPLGRIMLKGDNVTLIMGVSKGKAAASASS
mmetsp:Transcript_18253/g.35863  ORF Transcript_18253/g.35863 Transcript_18253/m.35863 type:complete len:100 (+) Transcript_18253:415-714(+)|eukprot:CAMPEP_0171499978 /NCGR_PEP_ID=MMETSP0958-20121227/8726_1 /TAXON_ID=87120 /ORGANISM="Aurantiochytrium limacinum, Strain ATCCMYA-1381" /LENGTH=99 /DNA_ID=CAMNT_0012034589 /DNA_START=358 /DNA_END=657 /DNA_ORIENTATION=-